MIKRKKKNKFLHVKTKIVHGLKCQGNKEARFVNECYRKNIKISKAPRIITPYGSYTPDFELEDKYIEIKSKATFEVCIGLTTYIKSPKIIKEPSDLQFRKIQWVAENIKSLEMKIYLSKTQKLIDYELPKYKNLTITFVKAKKKVKVIK